MRRRKLQSCPHPYKLCTQPQAQTAQISSSIAGTHIIIGASSHCFSGSGLAPRRDGVETVIRTVRGYKCGNAWLFRNFLRRREVTVLAVSVFICRVEVAQVYWSTSLSLTAYCSICFVSGSTPSDMRWDGVGERTE